MEYLALAGLMNLLAQLVDKERNVLIPAFKNKTKNIAINHYYQPSTFFTLWKISHKNTTASLPPKDMMILLKSTTICGINFLSLNNKLNAITIF